MSRFQFSRADDGSEVRADLGAIVANLDADDRRLLWQALTIDCLGAMLGDSTDTLHVMFGHRADGQHRAQLDRIGTDGRPRHLLAWHGTIEDDRRRTFWRIHR